MLKGAHRYDAIVIGAGHNGLVCAAKLAKSGKSVLVLEARDTVGGMASTHEFAEGYSSSACAHVLHQLQPAVLKELDIDLEFAAEDMETIVLSATDAPARYRQGDVSGVPPADVTGYRVFHDRMRRFAGRLNRQLLRPPPRLHAKGVRDRLALLRLGFDVRSLGKTDMREFLRLLGMNVRDELAERLDHPLLRGGLSVDAVMGAQLGPRSPGTILTYLYRLTTGGSLYQVKGGMGRLTAAFAECARARGARVLTQKAVTKVIVENGRAIGVECADGECFASLTVVSNADPETTVMKLVGARHFETRFVHRIRHLRNAGCVAKLHLALDGLPQVNGLERRDLAGRLIIAPDEDYVERAFNAVKYGEFSHEPAMELTFPSFRDPSLAPAGMHVLSANVLYAPHRHVNGWTDTTREAFMRAILAQLSTYMPDIEERIRATELLTPVDIERQFLTTGGHWHHAELAFDQFMFVRPVVGAAHYELPLEGLFLCGAGAHPGGGVTGAPGHNAARAILHQERIV